MSGLKQWAIDSNINRTSIGRIVGTFVVGLLLFLTVACSNAPSNPAGNSSSMSAPSTKLGVQKLEKELAEKTPETRRETNVYDYSTPENKSKVQAKTRELVDTAKRTMDKNQSLEDLPSKISKSAENVKNNISEGLENQKDDLVKGTKNGIKNLKKNLDKASKEIPNVVQEATENAASALK